MSDFWFYALLAALVIVFSLTCYAGKLLKQLAKQKADHDTQQKAQQAALKQHDKKVFASVVLITRAMQQEQCEFDEGCWRLSVLLSSLKTLSDMPVKFPNIYGLYDEIKGFAILDARKKLTKKERMREDYQRMVALDKSHDQIVIELDALYQYSTGQLANFSI